MHERQHVFAMSRRVLCLLPQERLGFRGDIGVLVQAVLRFPDRADDVSLNGTAMNVKALQNRPKFGLAGCHMKGTVVSNSHGIFGRRGPSWVTTSHRHAVTPALGVATTASRALALACIGVSDVCSGHRGRRQR